MAMTKKQLLLLTFAGSVSDADAEMIKSEIGNVVPQERMRVAIISGCTGATLLDYLEPVAQDDVSELGK